MTLEQELHRSLTQFIGTHKQNCPCDGCFVAKNLANILTSMPVTTFEKPADSTIDFFRCSACSGGFDFEVVADPEHECKTNAGRSMMAPRFCPLCGAKRKAAS